MKGLIIAAAVTLMLCSTAQAGWYVGPTYGYSYYAPAPVYYPAPVVVAGPRVVYSPIVAPAPVWVGPAVVVGPAGKVYVTGRPVRNAVRAVLP